MRTLTAFILAAPLSLAACAGLDRNDQGNLQPQSVTGPCEVRKFFIMNFTSARTELTVAANGQACTFTIFNPALQLITTAALITAPPSHGHAEAGLVLAGRSAAVSYTPQPGYTGPDSFSVTLEPNARGAIFGVTVRPAG